MKTDNLLASCWATPNQQLEFTVREWETLLGQARQARLLARLATHYLEQGWLPSIPDGPRTHLAVSYTHLDVYKRQEQGSKSH